MKFFTIIFLLFNSINIEYHPIHLSVTNVEYIKAEKKYKILLRVFADDFKKVVDNFTNENLNFENISNKNQQKIIMSYLNNKFQIKADSKILGLTIENTRYEKTDNVLWITLVSKKLKPAKTVSIRNEILNDLYYDQKNMLIFKQNDFEEAVSFKKEYISEVFKP